MKEMTQDFREEIRAFLNGVKLSSQELDEKFLFIKESVLAGAILHLHAPIDETIGRLQCVVDFLCLQTHSLDMYSCGDTLGKDSDIEAIDKFIKALAP